MNYEIDKVVYFGYHETIERLKSATENFLGIYCGVQKAVFHALPKDDLASALRTMRHEIEYEKGRKNRIFFDVTGGEDLILVAFGMLAKEFSLPLHSFDVPQNRLIVHDDGSGTVKSSIDELVARSPYYKATANDVDWLEKVRMQGRIQKWVDHSISVTINLPNDVSEELVNDLYIEAWKCGCKGCTVYRDGSRSGVLVEAKKEEKPAPCNCYPEITPKRPKELECDVVRFQNNKEKWIAFVGLLNGRPYEIFTGLLDDEDGLMLPKSVTTGKIIRNYHEETGVKTYDFQFTNKYGYKITIEGLSHKFNPEFWNYAKLISGVLRYGMPIDQIVRLVGSLQLNNESINNWKMGVERALKKYIPDGADTGQKCPQCGQPLTFTEGCMKCNSCGYSKCGG